MTTNLISHWKLDEASGTRFDTHGINHLSENTLNPPIGSAVGRIGKAVLLDGGASDILIIPSNSSLQMGDINFTIAGWVWFSLLTTTGIVGKWTAPGDLEYLVFFSGTNLRFHVSNDGASNVSVTNPQSITTGAWYFFVAWHDKDANTINLSVNNNDPVSTTHSTGVKVDFSDFTMGTDQSGGTNMDGRLDSVSIWKRLLNSRERTLLYNSGNGLEYPFKEPGPTHRIRACRWKLGHRAKRSRR
jgi:hypothetical protein